MRTYLVRLLTETFTTTPFERSRFRQFEASSHKAAPMDLPSSLIQHRVLKHVLDTTPHRTGRETLASSGSCHPSKATAFHHCVSFVQANLLTRHDVAKSARGVAPRAAYRSVRESLDSYGSCHPMKAAAFRHIAEFLRFPVDSA